MKYPPLATQISEITACIEDGDGTIELDKKAALTALAGDMYELASDLYRFVSDYAFTLLMSEDYGPWSKRKLLRALQKAEKEIGIITTMEIHELVASPVSTAMDACKAFNEILCDYMPPHSRLEIVEDGDDPGLYLLPDINGAMEDDDVFKGDAADAPTYCHLCLEINDHGNATLWHIDEEGNFSEVWAVV